MGVRGGRLVTHKQPWSESGVARHRDVRTGKTLGSWAAVDGATLSSDGTTLALPRRADGRVEIVRVP